MSIFERAVLTQVGKARGGSRPAQWLLTVDGREVGLLEKYRDSRTDKHPWKAFVYVRDANGRTCEFLDAYYGPSGRILARNAVLESAGLLS